MNTLWFWFDKQTRRALHGTPEDCFRKFRMLDSMGMCSNGLEIFLAPSKLGQARGFDPEFIRKFSKLTYRSVHIGEGDDDYLDSRQAFDDLVRLGRTLEALETDNLVIHAHHLEKNRKPRVALMRAALGNTRILVENNGHDHPWGGSIQGLSAILNDCEDLFLCLDIAHIRDFPEVAINDYISNPLIVSRIQAIHYSYSTYPFERDAYEDKGFGGYRPLHALFSVMQAAPSRRTKAFVRRYPVVMEGILPPEDRQMRFLKEEAAILER
jgi:hypothetical protein